jgi:hypothetical protein
LSVITPVVVTGTVLDASQQPADGQVIFCPATGLFDAVGNPTVLNITDAAGKIVVPMAGVTCPLTAGQLMTGDTPGVELIPTDAAGLASASWVYQVTYQIAGVVPDYSFLASIPYGSGTVDLSELVPVPPGWDGSSQDIYNLTVPQGDAQNLNVRLTIPATSLPFGIDPAAWQYVVRDPGDDGTGTPLAQITPEASGDGLLTITSTAGMSLVNIQIFAAVTQRLTPGTYSHALWEFPATPDATAVFTGLLTITEAAQAAA